MTAKEKSKELVCKFQNVPLGLYIIPKENEDIFCLSKKEAKQCALIAVDEIIKLCHGCMECGGWDKEYWQEVKKEINKL